MFEYETFTAFFGDHENSLQDRLSRLGADGWRLHTCEPLNDEDGNIVAFVVMDRLIAEEPQPEGKDAHGMRLS